MPDFEFKLSRGGMHSTLQHSHSLETTSTSLAMTMSTIVFLVLFFAGLVFLYIRSLRKFTLQQFKVPLTFFAYDDGQSLDRDNMSKIVADFTLNSSDARSHRYDIILRLQLHLFPSQKCMDDEDYVRRVRVGLLLENEWEKHITIRTQTLEPTTRVLSMSLSTIDLGATIEPLNGLVTLALDERIMKARAINAVTAFLLFERRRQSFAWSLFGVLLHWVLP